MRWVVGEKKTGDPEREIEGCKLSTKEKQQQEKR